MDRIVIILIGAGVCCLVMGAILFLKLCQANPEDRDAGQLVDPEYADNFRESFKNTGSIVDTLEELLQIYADNPYMNSLIANALDYIRDGQGDYETALEGINADGNIEIMKMHNAAIKKELGAGKKQQETSAEPEDGQKEETEEFFEEDAEPEEPEDTERNEDLQNLTETEKNGVPYTGKNRIRENLRESRKRDAGEMNGDADGDIIPEDEENEENCLQDDDDLDGFKIG